MRIRALVAAGTVVLALGGLAGCRSNIGTAAVVNGEKISDTQIANSITRVAQPVQVSQTASLAPRPFVVEILVSVRLFRDIVAKGPNGGPTDAQLAAIARQALGGKSAKAFAESREVKGYSASFDRQLISYIAYVQVLRTYGSNGVDIEKLARSARTEVHISPRYGSWNATQLSLNTASNAGLPGFISLQPAPAAGAGTVQVPNN